MKASWKAAVLCFALALAACSNDDNPAPADNGNGGDNGGGDNNGGGTQQSGPAMLLGIEGTNLLQFRAGAPATIINEEPLTGYAGEGTSNPPSVVGIDFRGNGVLYVLMSDNNLYVVNPSSGQVTLVSMLQVGTTTIRTFNWDFSRDRIRALGINGANLEFNPDGTLFAQETSLQYASSDPHAGGTPDVEALAFSGGSGGTPTAYGLDSTQQTLVTIGNVGESPSPPDTGQVFTVHALSSAVEQAGTPAPFDIETVANPAGYLSVFDGTATNLFQVNLSTGALSVLGVVGHERHLTSIAVIPGTSGLGDQTGGGGAVPGDALCTTPIQGVGTTVVAGLPPANCLGCDVQNPPNLIDTDPATFARFQYTAAVLLAGIEVTVTSAPGIVYPIGDIAGGVFAFPPNDVLEVTIAPDLTITTLLAGSVQESVTLGGDTVILDLGGAVNTGDKFFAGFTTTKPFDAIRVLPTDGVIGALTQLDMYSACAGAPSEGAFP